MRRLAVLVVLLPLGLSDAPARAETLEQLAPETFRFLGSARVVDGDTIDVETVRVVDRRGRAWGGQVERLRLHGIDAPERGEPGYRAATDALAALIGPRAQCVCLAGRREGEDCARDRWGRVLAVCAHAGEASANGEMVRRGYARARYGCDYLAEERAARAAGRGLWPGLGRIPSDCD